MLYWMSCFSTLILAQCSRGITWPTDTEATVGSDVVFNCTTSSSERPLEWHHVPVDSSTVEISHRDGQCLNGYCERYSMVSNTPGEYSLRIRNVSIEDAGTHRCVLANNDQREAELTVIVIYPSKETCSARLPTDGSVIGHNHCQMEPDRIELSCSLKYVGNKKTFLEWTQTTANDVNIDIINTTAMGTTTSKLILNDAHLQEATFLCHIGHLNSNDASSYNCSFHVNAAPLRLRKATVESNLQRIDCASDLPYRCTYSWKYDTEEIASSQTLNLTGRKYGTYICAATCEVRSRPCTFLSDEVTYQPSANTHVTENSSSSEENNTTLIISVVVAVVVVVLGIIIIIIIIIIKIRKLACFSQPPANEERTDHLNEDPPTDAIAKLSQEEGEESVKLLQRNGEEPIDRILNWDDEAETKISDLSSASQVYNINLRNVDKIREIGNLAGREDTKNTESSV